MIQRIQSIWLLLAALVISALFYTQMYSVTDAANATARDYNSIVSIKNNFIGIALTALSTVFSLVAIFLYKNRKQQTNLIWLNVLITVGLFTWLFIGINNFWNDFPKSDGHLSIGIFLPVINVFLLLLALRGIRKDEKLIKSLDRLR